jgi:DinB superfamily
MKKSDINPMPAYFDRYINLAADVDVNTALQQSLEAAENFPMDKWRALGDMVYAPGKWTVKDMIQHITDTERIFAYRALRFARKDSTKLPGFEENDFAAAAGANARGLEDLVEELKQVRRSTIALFASFTGEMLQTVGATFSASLTPLAIGFTIAGHQQHHLNVLEERYYPLLQQ